MSTDSGSVLAVSSTALLGQARTPLLTPELARTFFDWLPFRGSRMLPADLDFAMAALVDGRAICIPEPQLAELPNHDDRDTFEDWVTDFGRWPKAAERSGESYRLMHTHYQWQAWKARTTIRPNASFSGERSGA